MAETTANGGISKEAVVEKLKDDGDFDKLRLKIIRKLKDNEELRNNIISVVKQSAALNRAGADNLKPRQLSDAIFEEVRSEVMSQLSDSLWGIIRSENGMKSEIRETVQTVYNKLLHPEGEQEKGRSSTRDMMHVEKGRENNGSIRIAAGENDGAASDKVPDEPPGFTLQNHHHGNNSGKQPREELQAYMSCEKGALEEKQEESHQPTPESGGTSIGVQPCDDSDEDPDVPPGFG